MPSFGAVSELPVSTLQSDVLYAAIVIQEDFQNMARRAVMSDAMTAPPLGSTLPFDWFIQEPALTYEVTKVISY